MKKKIYINWDQIPVIYDTPIASSILGLSCDVIQKKCGKGEFPFAFKLGGEWRFDKALTQKFIKEQIKEVVQKGLNNG